MKKISTLFLLIFYLTISNLSAQTWVAMAGGLGVSTQSVKTIAVDPSGNVYAGGTFTGTYNYLAMWNGSGWVDLGSSFNGPVYSIGIKTASDIYIGGAFTSAGGLTVNNIVKWSGSTWSVLDSGFNARVNCVYVDSIGNVYAGGQFSTSAATLVNHIAKYVGGQWTPLGSGIGGVVNSIMLNNSILYAGCEIIGNPVQKFINNTWSAVSGISNGKVYALASFKNNLYVGGDFQLPYYAAARWDGSSWSSITTLFNSTHKIYALFNWKDSVLYIGGNFTGVGVGAPNYIGKIDGIINSPVKKFTVSPDLNGGEVYTIGNQNGKVIAGGKFSSPATNIAITSTTIDVNELNSLVIEKNFFPNPVVGKAHLIVSTKERLINPELKIYDLQSRIIQILSTEINISNNEIEYIVDCANLPTGNYYYVLIDEGKGVLSDKFVINRE